MPPKKTTACPARWGGGAWIALHMMTAAYPDRPSSKDRAIFRFAFRALPKLLPCNRCAQHFKDLLRKMPVEKALGSRPELMQWAHRAHAMSNKHVPGKKKERPPNLERVLPTFTSRWQKGLRDFLFVTAICLPSKHAGIFAKWTRVANRALGEGAPVVTSGKRSDMLNQLCKFYKVGRTKVVKRYTPWLNVEKKDAASKMQQVLRAIL